MGEARATNAARKRVLPFGGRVREHPRRTKDVNAPAWQPRAAHAPGAWPWTEITSILSDERFVSSTKRSSWTTRRYELATRVGGTLFLTDDSFENVQVIAEAIKSPVFDVLRPPLKAEYASGAAVSARKRPGGRVLRAHGGGDRGAGGNG